MDKEHIDALVDLRIEQKQSSSVYKDAVDQFAGQFGVEPRTVRQVVNAIVDEKLEELSESTDEVKQMINALMGIK